MMNTINAFLNNAISRSVYYSIIGIFVFSLLSFPICNYVYMTCYPAWFSWKEWIWIVPAIIMVLLTIRCGQGVQLKDSVYISPYILGFLFSNVIFVTVLLTYDTKPVSDWEYVWKAAVKMANGTFTDGIKPGTYLHEIPYQLGLSYFESILIRIFGTSYWVLKILNLILLNFITWSTYHFSKRKASEEVANYAYVAACMFLCYLMTVGQFTNHQIGFVFLYLSLYLYEKGRFSLCCLAGMMAAGLNFVRPMGIMVVATIFVYAIYLLTKSIRRIPAITNFLGFYISYRLVLLLLDLLLLNMNYTDEYMSKSTRNLYHKITYTTYESKIDGRIAEYNYDYEAYDDAYKAEIIDMVMNHPQVIAKNVANKMVRYLGLFDYLFELTYDHDESIWRKYPIKAIYSTQWFQYVIFLCIALYGYIKKKPREIDIYQIFFIGNTFVYLFVEAFSTYRFVNYFYFLYLVGYGLNEYENKNKNLIKDDKINTVIAT